MTIRNGDNTLGCVLVCPNKSIQHYELVELPHAHAADLAGGFLDVAMKRQSIDHSPTEADLSMSGRETRWPLRTAWKKLGTKRRLWEKIRTYFVAFVFGSMTPGLPRLPALA